MEYETVNTQLIRRETPYLARPAQEFAPLDRKSPPRQSTIVFHSILFNSASTSGISDLARHFAGAARSLVYVTRVLVTNEPGASQLWTVIDAPPFDQAYRTPIYLIEQASRDAFPSLHVEFKLVNIQEYEGSACDSVIPRSCVRVWERETGA